jgi:hypothetical protein
MMSMSAKSIIRKCAISLYEEDQQIKRKISLDKLIQSEPRPGPDPVPAQTRPIRVSRSLRRLPLISCRVLPQGHRNREKTNLWAICLQHHLFHTHSTFGR